jgi:hypothetical protein
MGLKSFTGVWVYFTMYESGTTTALAILWTNAKEINTVDIIFLIHPI